MNCTWDNPGADRYTGSIPAAIAAYHLPVHTQEALIEAFEKRQFDDVIYIDNTSIHGLKAQYEPEIKSMHFGSKGKTCDVVERKWKNNHVETALVACRDGVCVAWPSVCTNFFILTKKPEEPVGLAFEPPGAGGQDDTAGVTPASSGDSYLAPGVQSVSDAPFPGFGGGGGYSGGGGGVFVFSPSCNCVVPLPCPASAVPEPSTWFIFLAGLAVTYLVITRKK